MLPCHASHVISQLLGRFVVLLATMHHWPVTNVSKSFQSSLEARPITLGMTVQLGHCGHAVCIADIVRRYKKRLLKLV